MVGGFAASVMVVNVVLGESLYIVGVCEFEKRDIVVLLVDVCPLVKNVFSSWCLC